MAFKVPPEKRGTSKPWGETRVHPDCYAGARPTVGETPGASHVSRLFIDPAHNLLIGGESICHYLGIGSIVTLWRWVELYGLPVIKRPDGYLMTTMTAIDQWIFLAAEVANDNLTQSRIHNVRAEMAIERLQRQVDHDKFLKQQQSAALKVARGVGLTHGRKEPKVPYSGNAVVRRARSASRQRTEGEPGN